MEPSFGSATMAALSRTTAGDFVFRKFFGRTENTKVPKRPKIHVRRNGSFHIATKELFQSEQGREAFDKLRKVRRSAARRRMRRAY